ncbi:PEP-CTERM sorting domain-containing protein [Mucisphaera sp.]|uniref:PEP-CTERM sorting domain-containing protein n=1 Tax=Mucisphaera sp. TaxID=2913024 RepID=UPI003D0EB2D1
MKNACTSTLIAALTATGFAAAAQAQTPKVLISDQFERVSGNTLPDNGDTFSDWGANDNADGGSIVQTYITTPSRPPTDGGVDQTVQEGDGAQFDGDPNDNEGIIRFGAAMVNYDLASDPDVLFGGGYTVEFDFRRSGGFLSFFYGYDPFEAANTSDGAAFRPIFNADHAAEHLWIFQDDGLGTGRMQVFESTVKLDPPGDINGAFGFSTELHRASIKVEAPDGFDVGDQVTASISIATLTPGLTPVFNPVSAATHTVGSDGEHFGYIGWTTNSGDAQIDNLIISSLDTAPDGVAGDFNGDTIVDAADIDLLTAAIRAGSSDSQFDLDGSSAVDAGDLDNLISNILGTVPGDANLDSNVDLIDLSALATSFNSTAGWAGGNFNTDAVVDLIDLSLLATNFGTSAVPEPASLALLGLGALAAVRRR